MTYCDVENMDAKEICTNMYKYVQVVYPHTLCHKSFDWINEECGLIKHHIIGHAITISGILLSPPPVIKAFTAKMVLSTSFTPDAR